jgi:hypothetical protein
MSSQKEHFKVQCESRFFFCKIFSQYIQNFPWISLHLNEIWACLVFWLTARDVTGGSVRAQRNQKKEINLNVVIKHFNLSQLMQGALRRTNAENSKQIFPEKELRGHSPNFHIHVSLSDLYMYSHDGSAYSSTGKYVDRSSEYINRSQTHECGNWDWVRAIPRKGIHKWDFRCSVCLAVGGLQTPPSPPYLPLVFRSNI